VVFVVDFVLVECVVQTAGASPPPPLVLVERQVPVEVVRDVLVCVVRVVIVVVIVLEVVMVEVFDVVMTVVIDVVMVDVADVEIVDVVVMVVVVGPVVSIEVIVVTVVVGITVVVVMGIVDVTVVPITVVEVVGMTVVVVTAVPQAAKPTWFVSKVTAPFLASALPVMFVPVVTVMLVRARIFPLNLLFVPKTAELPTCQKTLHGLPPLVMTTDDALAVVRVLAIWKIHTALGSPCAFSVNVPVN
jgi:hypothetical protein